MKHEQKFLQNRKFAMVLPILVLPFLTLIFWALGGGKGTPASAQAAEKVGLNLELPNAHFNETEVWNKLRLYEQATRDSLKFQEALENDPIGGFAMLENEDLELHPQQPVNDKTIMVEKVLGIPFSKKPDIDPNEAKVNEKLSQLLAELNKNPAKTTPESYREPEQKTDPQFSEDVQKLEQMMELMSAGNQSDPEIQQIEGMLDKILDIQHPDRVREKIKAESKQHQQQIFPVYTGLKEIESTMMLPPAVEDLDNSVSSAVSNFPVLAFQNSFYGLEDEILSDDPGNAIEAVVHQTQELVSGATIKLRLLTDVFINGKLIEKNQFLYGVCTINGERLTVEVNSIRNENSLFPVALSVYDLDGLEGIYIPGAITREVAKQSADQALQGMQFMSMDQSLGAQAASAGIQAATGLFSKKVKLVKVTVKAGYKILLKDGNAG